MRGHGHFHVSLSLVDACEVYYCREYSHGEADIYRQYGREWLEDYIVAPMMDDGFSIELDFSTYKEPFRAEVESWTRRLALGVLDNDGDMTFHAVRVGGGKPRSGDVYRLVESPDGEMVMVPVGVAP